MLTVIVVHDEDDFLGGGIVTAYGPFNEDENPWEFAQEYLSDAHWTIVPCIPAVAGAAPKSVKKLVNILDEDD